MKKQKGSEMAKTGKQLNVCGKPIWGETWWAEENIVEFLKMAIKKLIVFSVLILLSNFHPKNSPSFLLNNIE